MTAVDRDTVTDQAPYLSEPDWDAEDDAPRRPVRKRLGAWSLLLCGAFVGTSAFLGGVLVEKHDVPAAPAGASGFGRNRGAGTGAAAGGVAAGAAGAGGGAAGAAGGSAAGAGGGAGGAAGTGGAGAGGVGTAGSGTGGQGATAAGAGAGGATFGRRGGGGGGGGGGGATIGTIKLIDGSNVYVADATGALTKIATTPQSTITITTTGSTSDLKPGDTVIATGSTGPDGTITATSVRDQGPGGAARGG